MRNATHLIHDRDRLFKKAWRELLQSEDVKSVRIPASSPNCNAYAERLIRTARDECLRHFVIFGERHLRHPLREFIAHYLAERLHQGLVGQLVRPTKSVCDNTGAADGAACRSRPGWLLKFHHRWAA